MASEQSHGLIRFVWDPLRVRHAGHLLSLQAHGNIDGGCSSSTIIDDYDCPGVTLSTSNLMSTSICIFFFVFELRYPHRLWPQRLFSRDSMLTVPSEANQKRFSTRGSSVSSLFLENNMSGFPWRNYVKFLETPVMTVVWGLPLAYMCNDISSRLQRYGNGPIAFVPYIAMFATLFAISTVWWYLQSGECLPRHHQDTSNVGKQMSETSQGSRIPDRLEERAGPSLNRSAKGVGDGRRGVITPDSRTSDSSGNHLPNGSVGNEVPSLAPPSSSPETNSGDQLPDSPTYIIIDNNGDVTRLEALQQRANTVLVVIIGEENVNVARAVEALQRAITNITTIDDNVDVERAVEALQPHANLRGSRVLHKRIEIGFQSANIRDYLLHSKVLEYMRTARAFDKDCIMQLGSIAVLKGTDACIKCWMLQDHWAPSISHIRRSPQSLLGFLSGESPEWTVIGCNLEKATLTAATTEKSETLNILHRYKREKGTEVLLFKQPLSFEMFQANVYISASNLVEVEEGVNFKLYSEAKKVQRAYWVSVVDGFIPCPPSVIIMAGLSLLGGFIHASLVGSIYKTKQEFYLASCFAIILLGITLAWFRLCTHLLKVVRARDPVVSQGGRVDPHMGTTPSVKDPTNTTNPTPRPLENKLMKKDKHNEEQGTSSSFDKFFGERQIEQMLDKTEQDRTKQQHEQIRVARPSALDDDLKQQAKNKHPAGRGFPSKSSSTVHRALRLSTLSSTPTACQLVTDLKNLDVSDSGCLIAEYIWMGANGLDLRSKGRTVKSPITSAKDLPKWKFKRSSENQVDFRDSEIILDPRAIYRDPFRKGNNILVMCDTYVKPDGTPLKPKKRAEANKIVPSEEPSSAIEQEYTLLQDTNWPLGWPLNGYPGSSGSYYCGVGANKAAGRDVVDAHYKACLYAGIHISAVSGGMMLGQWKYQLGPAVGVSVVDQLWVSRYILERITETAEVVLSLSPKLSEGDWIGVGYHTNYSTKSMREEGVGDEKTEKGHRLRSLGSGTQSIFRLRRGKPTKTQ